MTGLGGPDPSELQIAKIQDQLKELDIRVSSLDQIERQSQRDSAKNEQLKAFVRDLIDSVEKKLTKFEGEFRTSNRITKDMQQQISAVWE